eukprot:TRINITY_DN23132_c0_g1_i1.p1 TRINITY_DN23132_c0_g1~~TRINITY_DN23132_c0_g1_i1.p1  ORF type:complete len:1084 (+),score=167.04 TRINITY_DN23132_c0_g1_i1:28-3252(+)
MELNSISGSKTGRLLPGSSGTPAESEERDVEASSAQEVDSTDAMIRSVAAQRRVASVKVHAAGAIDRIAFEYSDGSKWSVGGPGGDKGIAPLILADDEYICQVRHESLPQWWWVGSSVEFHTSKGRVFRHVAGWGSGEDEDMVSFKASPGKCIMALRLHDGELTGIVEGEAHVAEGSELLMYMAYWIDAEGGSNESIKDVKCPKGHTMRKDWSRSGHICDQCSRHGTAARCAGGCDYDLCEICYRHHAEGWGSSVQKKGFASRDAALAFAVRHGAPHAGVLTCGPLRLELEDHPWLDAFRECREASARLCSNLRSLIQQAVGQRAREGPLLPNADQTRANIAVTETTGSAGIVVDVTRGTRVRAWGAQERLSMCEKAAADAGEFNIREWASKSSSLRGWLDWFIKTIPLVWKVLSLLDWKRNVAGTATVAICIMIRSACDAWQPVLTGAVFNLVNGDQHEVERESHFLYFLCSWTWGCTGRLALARAVILGLMLAAIVQGLARVIGENTKKAMRARQNAEMRAAMFEHLLAQDQALYDILRHRDMVRKVELRAMSEVTEWIWGMASDSVKLATQMVFLFSISPLMTITYTVLLPLFEHMTRRYLERGLRAQYRRQEGLNAVSGSVVGEAVSMIRTVKCFSREDKHVALVSLAAGGAAAESIRNNPPYMPKSTSIARRVRHGVAQLLPEITQKGVYCLCLWFGLVWMERDFTAGDMTAYLLLIQQVGGLVHVIRANFHELQRRHDMLLEHFEFMEREPQVTPGSHQEEVAGRIEFRDVEFAYPARPEVKVLHGVSFLMEKGTMTALVGASGSGKSTVAALLFRHYDPLEGAIFVDEVDMREWNTTELHSRMALVAQQPLLFDTSIRNNLTYGCRRRVSDEEIQAAARLALAHDFIMGFPAGYDTYVGDQGAQISGGQKQRLSIARAVILKPQILVLDEATSALDAESEGLVQDALDTVMVDRTTLVIAHRLSTIRTASMIVCMRDGKVVEKGPPKELLARKGYYWSLVRRQVCTLDDLSDFNLDIDQKREPEKELAEDAKATVPEPEAAHEEGELDETIENAVPEASAVKNREAD